MTFRNGRCNLMARAPECQSTTPHTAWDAGHIVLFTPTTNVYVQGDGFFFTESNHILDISNNVETRVLRTLLKTPLLGGQPTNAPSAAGQIYDDFLLPPANSITVPTAPNISAMST